MQTSTSGSVDFTILRNEIITRALRIVGACPQGQYPSVVQIREAAEALNALVKNLQTQGLRLWLLEWTTHSLTTANFVIGTDSKSYKCIRGHKRSTINSQPISGNDWTTYWVEKEGATQSWAIDKEYNSAGDFVLPADAIGIDKAFLRYEGIDTSIYPITIDNYFEIQDKSAEGIPDRLVIIPERHEVSLSIGEGYENKWRVYLYPCPLDNLIGKAILHYQKVRKTEDFDHLYDAMDGTMTWAEPLIYGLAANLADEYQLSINERAYLQNKAENLIYKSRLEDVERVEMCFIPY